MKNINMKEINTAEKIKEYGMKIDRCIEKEDYNGLKSLLVEMEQFIKGVEEVRENMRINYFLGTGFDNYSGHLIKLGNEYSDEEVIAYKRKALYYYRNSMNNITHGSEKESAIYLSLLTNYANCLESVGRVIEALRIYREALSIKSSFAMAYGNYGCSLRFLARIVNDNGHRRDIHCYAYQAIKKALSIDDPNLYEQAKNSFKRITDNYESSPWSNFLSTPITYKEYELGTSNEEIAYRKWCLENHLFLNPMNEVIETEAAFAHDPLTICRFTEPIDVCDSVSENHAEPPRWYAMLNQLKEEYIYARVLCYSGTMHEKKVHFADKEVALCLASYDNTNYSIRIEQLKSAYRISYSLLDQICFFINDFWKLGFTEYDASESKMFKALGKYNENQLLNSLYWVLCEFHEKYGDAEKPYGKDMKDLRNAMEHKYIKVHEYEWNRKLQLESDSFYHISEEDLKKHILDLLRISREAVMYLVYAIELEERKKSKDGKSADMYISNIPDEWKR